MEKVIISIIIPVYNAEQFLPELLDSILKQTMTSFEVIIINDGSTDQSQSVIDLYRSKDSRIKAYRQNNQGQSAARNNALQYVNGEYIAFLDADDIISEVYLEKLYEATAGWKDISLCSYQKFESESGRVLLQRRTADWNVSFRDGYSHVFQYSPCARLMKTSFVMENDLHFGVGEQLEDGPYCMMAGILANDVGIINDILYFYRVYNTSTMGYVREGKKKPKVPYNSLEMAITKVQTLTTDHIKLQILEYCSIKIMAGWLTNMYKNADFSVHKEICSYCYRIINTYFKGLYCNPFICISTGSDKLPFSHRAAVILFVLASRLKLLGIYSSASVFLLKVFNLEKR